MQVGLNPKKPVFLDETSAKTNMTRLYGRAPKGKRLVDKTPHFWKKESRLGIVKNRTVNGNKFYIRSRPIRRSLPKIS